MDGEWKTDSTQPVDEQNGYKNNVISLENFVTYDMEEKEEKKRKKQEIEMKYKQRGSQAILRCLHGRASGPAAVPPSDHPEPGSRGAGE